MNKISLDTRPKFQGYREPNDYVEAGVVPVEPQTAKEEGREELLEDMLNSLDYIAENKLDGVRATIHFYKDHTRVFSRRISKKTGWYTENSDSLPHIRDIAIPELDGTIIDAELTMPSGVFKDIASIMNCNYDKAIERQEEQGLVIVNAFDIVRYCGDSVEDKNLITRKHLLEIVISNLDNDYINEVSYFDNKRAVAIDVDMRGIILEKNEIYPTLFEEMVEQCGLNECSALKTNLFRLGKKAYYEYYVAKGGEGIILKAKDGLYFQKRGREYTKVKKFTTRDVVIIDFTLPTRKYLGKYTATWRYWEDPVTKVKIDKELKVDSKGNRVLFELYDTDLQERFEPVTKFYYEDWVGNIQYGVRVTNEELKTWEKINPKEKVYGKWLDGLFYLSMGETSGLTEEERIYFSENIEEIIGTVIEVKCHEVIKKTGKLRHPRFLRRRPDKEADTCNIVDHLEG